MAKRKCKQCGEIFVKERPLQYVCSPVCGQAYAQAQRKKNQIKAQREAKRQERAQTAAKRRELETVPELIKKAQRAFNRFIRLRDRGKPCISCGKPLGGAPNSYDAGHYRSVGGAAHLRFDEANCHGQCKHCNNYLSGNVVMYRMGLLERIGETELARLENDSTTRKWDKDGLRELIDEYRQKARELEA